MTVIPVKEKLLTFDEYCAIEERAEFKHEFDNGRRIPIPESMSGGSLNHGRLKVDLIVMLANLLANRTDIEIFNSDTKVYMPLLDKGVYPDASVLIGKIEPYGESKHAYSNPSLIFEVLSKSTASYYRDAKFKKYQSLPSFQEYVLIAQDRPVVDVFFKKAENLWELSSFIGLDEVVQLQSVHTKLPMRSLYKRVENLKSP